MDFPPPPTNYTDDTLPPQIIFKSNLQLAFSQFKKISRSQMGKEELDRSVKTYIKGLDLLLRYAKSGGSYQQCYQELIRLIGGNLFQYWASPSINQEDIIRTKERSIDLLYAVLNSPSFDRKEAKEEKVFEEILIDQLITFIRDKEIPNELRQRVLHSICSHLHRRKLFSMQFTDNVFGFDCTLENKCETFSGNSFVSISRKPSCHNPKDLIIPNSFPLLELLLLGRHFKEVNLFMLHLQLLQSLRELQSLDEMFN